MIAQWTPMRWPGAWKDPGALDLLKGSAINYLLVDKGDEFEPVRLRALQEGLHVAEPGLAQPGIVMLKGEWPGVRMTHDGPGQATGGPTGVPWVDSNGWSIRLSAALHPENTVWVDAPPAGNLRITAGAYAVAIADSAAHGGRWVISLDSDLAAGLNARKQESLATWKQVNAAARFFAARKTWAEYSPAAVAGVISDFTGPNEFLGQELLNLLARAGLHYRIVRKDIAKGASLEGLRAVIYADGEPPAPELRNQILAFVQAGGLLITFPQWGPVSGPPAKDFEHPRFSIHSVGKGKIAQASTQPDDPYDVAGDVVVLVSHRYDLVRFWNGGATGSYYAVSPDRKQAVVHLFFYANRAPDSASVRVAGPYRTAKVATVDRPELQPVHVELQRGAIEVHLPQVPQYVALELT